MNNRRRPRMANNEKSAHLGLTLRKLLKLMNKYTKFIIVALVLSILSSVLSIIGPNKLSDLTDEISSGIVINKKNLESLSLEIASNLSEENLLNITNEIINFNLDEETVKEVTSSSEISMVEKMGFYNYLDKVKESNLNIYNIDKLSINVKKIILKDSKYNDIIITTEDKLAFLSLIGNIKNQNGNYDFDKIPLSIKKILLPDTKISGVKITTEDKISFITSSKNINQDNPYKALDKVSSNVKKLILPSMNFKAIKAITLFLVIMYLFSAIFNYAESYIMATISNLFSMDLRNKISEKINRLPLKYFDRNSHGDVLSRITNDADLIGSSLSQSLGSLVGALTLFIGSTIMMFVTNWIMAVTAILSSLIGFIFMSLVLSKSQKYFELRQTSIGNLNGHIEEAYSSYNVIKAYNGNKTSMKKFNELNSKVYISEQKGQFLSGLMPSMMGFIGNFGYVCVCIVGAMLVMNNVITFGVIVAFIIYVRLFSSPLSQIASGMMELQSTGAAGDRVLEFIEEQEMDSESNFTKKLNPKKVKGNIEFKHVKFGYNDNKTIIKDFNCKVKPGHKIAIVGPTGAGKTTLVNLLMKFYNINEGDILIDGISTKELTRENIHDLFIMVLQDTWLFEGTVKENIIYNKKNVKTEDVKKACKTVGLDHFIKTLPNGYDTILSDSENISSGQKQLLTIARGMIKDAPFLILDEATSSVDTRTEELVQKAMDKLMIGRTSFIIAHRLSTIKNADLILVMKDGNIIEQGNHEELINKNGFYADLYNSQFKK